MIAATRDQLKVLENRRGLTLVSLSWLKRSEQTRETRLGWPLLTVKTEANGDSWSTYERGPSLVGSLGSKFLSCLGCSRRPSKKYFFPQPYTILQNLFPSPSKLGRHSCRVACFLICASGTYNRRSVSSYVPHFFKTQYRAQNYIFLYLCDFYSKKMCFHVRNACK
jgi:hypothetical protein